MERCGWSVPTLDAVVLGSLGSWLPTNDTVLQSLGVSSRYLWLAKRLLASKTIGWSRDVYTEHITGVRQYHPQPPTTSP